MFEFNNRPDNIIQRYIREPNEDYLIQTNSKEEKVILLILRDLIRIGWKVYFKNNRINVTPPEYYDKSTIKYSMECKRREAINNKMNWINTHITLARDNLADGTDVWNSEIIPIIEPCITQKQFDVFRIFRYYWSSPYSEYVGRRIKLIFRDSALQNKPVIGIAAIGSSIIHIPDRDAWIGWDKSTRTNNLIYTMDAYVIGAIPPYNYLLGGKLISYLLCSQEIREIFRNRYKDVITSISRRQANDIACIFTTSLYGKSSQYNRINYHNRLLYKYIGQTKGYGTFHLTDETFNAMRELIEEKGIKISNRFGSGPIWRMRLIRSAAEILGFDSDFLLKHSFKRGIYITPLASNYKEFLQGKSQKLEYYNYSMDSLVEYWKNRWLNNRKKRPDVKEAVTGYKKTDFVID